MSRACLVGMGAIVKVRQCPLEDSQLQAGAESFNNIMSHY